MRFLNFPLVLPIFLLTACGGTSSDSSHSEQFGGPHLLAVVSVSQQSISTPITLPYQRSAYLIAPSGSGNIVRLAGDQTDQGLFVPANGVVRFSDTSLIPYAENGNMPSAYRLYRAAFARTPDTEGLLYWIGALNEGASLDSIANGFVSSAEFKAIYGNNSNDPSIILGLYRNVLGREPDAAGLAYWQQVQRSGVSLAQILTSFSDSAENKAWTAPQVAKGISFKENGVVYSGATAPVSTISLAVSGSRYVGSTVVIKPEIPTAASASAVYVWNLLSKPLNSKVQVNATTGQLNFIPDAPGAYQLGLTITDNGRNLTGSVQITVTEQRLLNKPYLAKSGMTVTLESVTMVDHGANYIDYVITYVQSNMTQFAIDEGMLKLYFQNTSPMPQYGGFNKIYPGDTLRRTYTFTQLKSEATSVLEYDQDNFFRTSPAIDSLQWAFPVH
jgi:hypothetical protein